MHRGKVERLAAGPAPEGRRGTSAQADQHAWPAQHHQLGAHRDLALLDVQAPNIAESTGQHDGFVITARAPRRVPERVLLEAAEVPADARPAEFIVECGRTDRSFEHDLERRGNARGCTDGLLPRLLVAGQAQMGH